MDKDKIIDNMNVLLGYISKLYRRDTIDIDNYYYCTSIIYETKRETKK